MILIDSNVIVAALFEDHPRHRPSALLLNSAPSGALMAAAHSITETYSTLTRPNRPYKLTGDEAMKAIDTFSAASRIVALSAGQTLDAIRRFSAFGAGPRLYDYLIGATGEMFGADTIVTWNPRDFDGLFPGMAIITPDQSMR